MAVSKQPLTARQTPGESSPGGADLAKETDVSREPDDGARHPAMESESMDTDLAQPDIKATVVTLYEAFSRGDRPAFEALITDDFRFTSPYDDAIDRAEFFERCWPNHTRQKQLTVKRIGVDGAGAFVTYNVEFVDGHHAENTEWLAFRDGKVESVDVYFGASDRSTRADRGRDTSPTPEPHFSAAAVCGAAPADVAFEPIFARLTLTSFETPGSCIVTP
jgi:ketosteroid isomerase-like protein